MSGRVVVHPEPVGLDELRTAFADSRAGLDERTPVALTIASVAEPGRLVAHGRPQQVLELPPGSLLVGLALAHDSVLLDTPADRLLNRNVRGLLRGLRAQYFGTEHVVVAGQPVGWLDWDRDARGRALIIAAIGVERALSTDPISTMRGRAYASLRSVGEHGTRVEIAERIVAGYGRYGLTAPVDAARRGQSEGSSSAS